MANQKTMFRALLLIAFFCLLLFFGILATEHSAMSGYFLTAFFVLLALSFRGFERLKSFSFTIWIFAAVTMAMYFPHLFISVGDFPLKKLIIPLLQLIMFGMGSQMSVDDFTGVLKMPKGVIIGITAQYTIMPFLGFAIASLFSFPPEIAAGVLLIGCAPSGLASNVMSYIARANLALSVTLASIATLISPVMTPLLMKLLAGQYIEIKFWTMMLDIINMMILPVVAGFTFNLFSKALASRKNQAVQLTIFVAIILIKNLILLFTYTPDAGEHAPSALNVAATAFGWDMLWFFILPAVLALLLRRTFEGFEKWMDQILAFLSMAGIAVIITIITAAGRDSLLEVGLLLIFATLIHNVMGYTLGYSAARLFGLPQRDCRTVAFEVGMQNGGLASGLALQMGKIATVGLAPAIFGPLMNITGSVLATFWRGKPYKEEKIKNT